MSARQGLRSSKTPQKESYPYNGADTLPPPPIGFNVNTSRRFPENIPVPPICSCQTPPGLKLSPPRSLGNPGDWKNTSYTICACQTPPGLKLSPPRSLGNPGDWKNTSYGSSGHQSSFEQQNYSTRSGQPELTDDESLHKTPEGKIAPAQEKQPLPESFSNNSKIIGIIVLVIVIGCGIQLFRGPPDQDPSKELECRDAFKRLMRDHQEQDEDVIRSMFVASQKMLKGQESLVNSIVLLYSSESSLSFVEDALISTTGCTPTGHSTPIVLRKENITRQMELDPGYVLTLFGDLLKRESIMLVTDVDLLPEGAAQAFHSICDSETPWAKPATVYFTIEIPKDTVVKPENLDRLAIGRLERSWRGLPPNILDPLITRITNQVLYIH